MRKGFRVTTVILTFLVAFIVIFMGFKLTGLIDESKINGNNSQSGDSSGSGNSSGSGDSSGSGGSENPNPLPNKDSDIIRNESITIQYGENIVENIVKEIEDMMTSKFPKTKNYTVNKEKIDNVVNRDFPNVNIDETFIDFPGNNIDPTVKFDQPISFEKGQLTIKNIDSTYSKVYDGKKFDIDGSRFEGICKETTINVYLNNIVYTQEGLDSKFELNIENALVFDYDGRILNKFYNIEYEPIQLTIKQRKVILTADFIRYVENQIITEDDINNALITNSRTPFADGDTLEFKSQDKGTYILYTDFKVKNENGDDVTNYYILPTELKALKFMI